MRRIRFLCIALIGLLFASCSLTEGAENETLAAPSSDAAYETAEQTKESISYLTFSVMVADPDGEPISGLTIHVYQNGEVCEEAVSDDDGEVTFILVMGQRYGVAITSPDGAALYYEEAVDRVNIEHTKIRITVYDTVSESREIFAYPPSDEEAGRSYTAYYIKEGVVYAPLTVGDRSYFIFTPERDGIYRIGASPDAKVTVGYYGAPAHTLRSTITEPKDNAVELEVKRGNVGDSGSTTTRYVIGVEAEAGVEGALMTVERIGDPVYTEEDEPWTDVLPAAELAPFTLKTGALVNLDITDESLTAVLSDKDGYYHLGTEDGPVILLRITENSPYLSAFTTICNHTRLGAYLYDGEGNLLRKENFNPLISAYAAVCDAETGVYPLDAALADMLKKVGAHRGWYDMEANTNLFPEVEGTVWEDTAWLFACCYLYRG